MSTRSASDGFEYLSKVIYGTASIGGKVIGVWSKMISLNRNINYVEPRPNGIVLGIIASAISGAVGFVISATLAESIIGSVGGYVSGGVVNGLSNGLRATGTVITYPMKITEGGGPREGIFTDGMYFGGNVNGKYITQYTGMYPQFAAFMDVIVADAVFNYF